MCTLTISRFERSLIGKMATQISVGIIFEGRDYKLAHAA